MTDYNGAVPAIAQALEKRGYETLTPVQLAMLDPALVMADALVSAQTGSGKTVAFGIAMAPTLLDGKDRFGRAEAPLALVIARNALASGFDKVMPNERRSFFYMPFMHSESLEDQERCVELFSDNEEQVRYAIEHRDIIANYGRFPHRNRALGRESSQEEVAFLSNHAGFGQ